MKIIFLGTQGSGKSTQAKLLAEKLNMPYLEMGQLLRDRANQGDDLAKTLKKILDSGHLVESETTISILRSKLATLDAVIGYVLDGFPRNYAQYNALDPDIDLVFYVNVTDEEATRRLMKRARSDDTKDALKKRLEIYHRETEPLLEKFQQAEILKEIDGERSVDIIHREILQFVNTYKKYQ
jgi:adenylate kinase